MIKPYYTDELVTLYLGDCRTLIADLPVQDINLVLTDPPYPDQHLEYGSCDISFLADIPCRQLIFWSAKANFPLDDYTAIHIWDKQCGCGSMYERLFERNGQKNWRVLHANVMNSTMAASYGRDTFYGHPSQKPQRLISQLIAEYSRPNDLLFDPFSGVGTTAWCAKKLGRRCIAIEISEKWAEKSAKRCSQTVMNLVTDNVTDNRRCQICKTLLTDKRADAVTCSDRCRQALKRLQMRVASGSK